MKTPTEKQIRFVEEICNVLGITNFPESSWQFTRWHFRQFISANIDAYYYTINRKYEELYYNDGEFDFDAPYQFNEMF